jgi:hypothetical protein
MFLKRIQYWFVHTIISQSARQYEKKVPNLEINPQKKKKKQRKEKVKKKQLNTKFENQHYIDILHNIF